MSEIFTILGEFVQTYQKQTQQKVKLIDAFATFQLLTALVQMFYMLLVGTFPFNSFLSGFGASFISFCLTICLRKQVVSPKDFGNISQERAFADYVVCNVVLFLTVFNFMG
eukprot:c30535_g1_i1.p1 GENE.c30535_g1_i1~~c30535_g1_i1.p1  ORF type:complete len:111 (+),score=36.57 c30535_g1_i1:50-382(+)